MFLYVLGIACVASVIVTFSPRLGRPKFDALRAAMFIILGLAAGLQLAVMHFYPESCLDLRLASYAVGGLVYIAGAIIYVVRYPECTRPGRFDLCGASHQIFHFCVLAACLIHYSQNYKAYIDRQNMLCPIWAH